MDPKRLREETRAEHEATEAVMPLTDPQLTLELYSRVLVALCSFVEGWEAWSTRFAPRGLEAMVEERRRGPLLRADLSALGVADLSRTIGVLHVNWAEVVGMGQGSAEPDGEDAGDFTAAFLGALYVMEGSRLGGRYLAQHVEAVLQLTPGQGNAYFLGAGEATGALWREVRARIAEVPEEFEASVIGAARRTFGIFGEAMRAGLAASELQ